MVTTCGNLKQRVKHGGQGVSQDSMKIHQFKVIKKTLEPRPETVIVSLFMNLNSYFPVESLHKLLLKIVQKRILLVIWQKGESQNGSNKKTKQAKFSEKQTFLTL